MTSQAIWIGIAVGVFFAGLGISYAVFSTTSDLTPMRFSSQQAFDQTMSQNPKMSQHWMDSMMRPGGMMGASPIEQHEEMLEMMEHIMEEEELRDHMLAHMIENQDLVHYMFSLMDKSPELKKHMEAHVTGKITEYETP